MICFAFCSSRFAFSFNNAFNDFSAVLCFGSAKGTSISRISFSSFYGIISCETGVFIICF